MYCDKVYYSNYVPASAPAAPFIRQGDVGIVWGERLRSGDLAVCHLPPRPNVSVGAKLGVVRTRRKGYEANLGAKLGVIVKANFLARFRELVR